MMGIWDLLTSARFRNLAYQRVVVVDRQCRKFQLSFGGPPVMHQDCQT